jgi:hypothetical protein
MHSQLSSGRQRSKDEAQRNPPGRTSGYGSPHRRGERGRLLSNRPSPNALVHPPRSRLLPAPAFPVRTACRSVGSLCRRRLASTLTPIFSGLCGIDRSAANNAGYLSHSTRIAALISILCSLRVRSFQSPITPRRSVASEAMFSPRQTTPFAPSAAAVAKIAARLSLRAWCAEHPLLRTRAVGSGGVSRSAVVNRIRQ